MTAKLLTGVALALALALALSWPVAALSAPPPPIGPVNGGGSAKIDTASAATQQIIALAAGKQIYVSYALLVAAGTTNVTFEYGTGTNCGTGTTSLSGALNLTAQVGFSGGNGAGAILIVPVGQALCIVNSQAVQISGWLTFSRL